MKNKGGRGPDYVQERTGHYCWSFSHGMTTQLRQALADSPVVGRESCKYGLHRCFLYEDVVGLRGCYPCVCFYRPAISFISFVF